MGRTLAPTTSNLIAGRELAPHYARDLKDAYIRALAGIGSISGRDTVEPADGLRALALLHASSEALTEAEHQLVGALLLAGATRAECAAALGIRPQTLSARLAAARTWATRIGTELVPDPNRHGNWLVAQPDASSETASRSSS
ncbi:hypothetical protein [Tsukamurella pulmonis]|uniref:hypothetical protein n=1 Tax=Tsukamurella pulmonis TaxID=47312 RepID=UPI000E169C70|nr:hypothetical protein [Tsukamurella pulmonis]RDH11469.1 hypothetical protein DVB88_12625 [Tsukamurella pulmonis]